MEMMAEASGTSYQQIQKYEVAENRLSASRLFEFSRLLDAPIDFFFEGIHNIPNPGIDQPPRHHSPTRSPLQSSEAFAESITVSEVLKLVEFFRKIDNPKTRKAILRVIQQVAC